jgi:hypothetical protein
MGDVVRRPYWLLAGAVGVLVSAYVHFHLYFEGGYRGIAPERFAGLTISRAFAINAVAGLVIAWALVVSVRFPRLAAPSALAGFGFAAATLAAYGLSRSVGLLGFGEDQTTTDALVAVGAEALALVALGGWLLAGRVAERRAGAFRPAPVKVTCPN